MSALLDKLKEKEQQSSTSNGYWKPEEGEVLEGTVAKIGSTITSNGDATYCDLQTEAGKVSLFLNSVLKQAFANESVQEGDTIAIKYLGLEKSKKGRQYKNYIVVKDDGDKEA